MRLRTKFSLLISLLVLLIVSGVTVSLYIAESRFLVREMATSRAAQIRGLAQVAKESLIVKDEILLLNYLKLLKNTKGLEYASITDTSGRVLAHTDINQLGTTLSDAGSLAALASDRLLEQDSPAVLDLALPVVVNDQKAGVARIGFSRAVLAAAVEDSLAVTRRRILLVGLAALGFGLLGALLLTRMMTSPIKRIAQGAQIIGKGKLDHTIDVTSRDELGDLAAEFNKMSGQLKELDQMKSDFVSSVTHELRSPLLSLKMYLDLSMKGTAGPVSDKQKEYLQIMKDCAVRLSRFIDDLLEVAKIERGKMEVTPQPTALAPLAREIQQLFQPQVDQKRITLALEVPEDLPKVMADPERTRQVIINLISNAVKFTPESGTITVKAAPAGMRNMEIAVRDTGIGIPADKLDRIFDKFEQVKDARGKIAGPKGTGLGLAIVKGIVEAQGGTIRVESVLDKGSVFRFTLPLAKE